MVELLVDPAGLAAQLPDARNLRGEAVQIQPVDGPVLFVAGTRHPSLPAQLTCLRRRAPVTQVGDLVAGLFPRGRDLLAERAETLAAALAAGQDAVLTTSGEPYVAGGDRLMAALLAQIVCMALEQVRPGALVLTGGDVATAVGRGLGTRAIAVEGEIVPGILWGRLLGGRADGVCLVTKAGGCGAEDVLGQILALLRGGANE